LTCRAEKVAMGMWNLFCIIFSNRVRKKIKTLLGNFGFFQNIFGSIRNLSSLLSIITKHQVTQLCPHLNIFVFFTVYEIPVSSDKRICYTLYKNTNIATLKLNTLYSGSLGREEHCFPLVWVFKFKIPKRFLPTSIVFLKE